MGWETGVRTEVSGSNTLDGRDSRWVGISTLTSVSLRSFSRAAFQERSSPAPLTEVPPIGGDALAEREKTRTLSVTGVGSDSWAVTFRAVDHRYS